MRDRAQRMTALDTREHVRAQIYRRRACAFANTDFRMCTGKISWRKLRQSLCNVVGLYGIMSEITARVVTLDDAFGDVTTHDTRH